MLPFRTKDRPKHARAEHRSPHRSVAMVLLVSVAAALGLPSTAAPEQPLPLAQERKLVDRLLAEEFRRLVGQNADPATPIDNRKHSYYAIAELGTPEAVEFLRRTYEQRKAAGKLYPENDSPDLVFMLWNIPTPESAALLLQMIRDGHRDLRLVKAYAAVAGDAALPELRRLPAEGKNDDIRVGARMELIRLGNETAVKDVLRRLAPPGPDEKDRQRVSDAIGCVIEARLVAAVPELRRLSDHFGPDDASHLHHRVVHTLLFLRDMRSIPRAIRLLEAAPPNAAEKWGLRPTVDVLREVTGQHLGNDAVAWRRWWEEQGKQDPNFTRPADWAAQPQVRAEAAAVEAAFLEWARTPAAGPIVPGPVVYVQEPTGKRPSTESVRYYREVELRLLRVPRIRIDGIEVERDRALVNFYGPSDRHGRGPSAELVKGKSGWTVRGYVKTTDAP